MENQLSIALSQNKLLKNVDISKINLNQVKGKLITISEGEILYREGDRAEIIYLVINGEINVIKKRLLGKTKSYIFIENDFFGHEEYFERTSRTSTAVALRDSYLIALSREETDYLVQQNSEVYVSLHEPVMEIDEETIGQKATLDTVDEQEDSMRRTFDEVPPQYDDEPQKSTDMYFKSIADSSRTNEMDLIQPLEKENKEQKHLEQTGAIDLNKTNIFNEDGIPKAEFDLSNYKNFPLEKEPEHKEQMAFTTDDTLDENVINKTEFELSEPQSSKPTEKEMHDKLDDSFFKISNNSDESSMKISKPLNNEFVKETDDAFFTSLSFDEQYVKDDFTTENIFIQPEKSKTSRELTPDTGDTIRKGRAPLSKQTIRDFKTEEILAEAEEKLRRIEKGEPITKKDNWRTMPDDGKVLNADQLQMIIKAAELVNSTIKIDEVLQNIVEVGMGLTNADRGTLYIIDREKKELYSFVAVGNETKEIRLKIGEGLAGFVAQTGETINIKNVQLDTRFRAEFDKVTGYNTRNMICFAIRNNKNEVIGVLQLLNSKNGEFSKRDEEFLSAISIHSAIALNNAELVEKLLRAERIQSLGKMANFLIQDIKKPILVSKRYAEHLKGKVQSPDIAQIVEMLLEQLNQVADLVQTTSNYSEEKTILRTLNTSLNNTFADYASRIGTYVESRNCQIISEYDKDVTVKLDVKEFYQCYLHIVKNACDAMPEGGNIYISTKRDDKQKKVMIYFKDNGFGIADSFKDKIFEPFMSYGKKEGTGLGLAITKKILGAHNGTIEVQSALGAGATFIITLPVASAF